VICWRCRLRNVWRSLQEPYRYLFSLGTDDQHRQVGFPAALHELLLNLPSYSDLGMCAGSIALGLLGYQARGQGIVQPPRKSEPGTSFFHSCPSSVKRKERE